MRLNYPKTFPTPWSVEKLSSQNQSLVPKRLETTALEQELTSIFSFSDQRVKPSFPSKLNLVSFFWLKKHTRQKEAC